MENVTYSENLLSTKAKKTGLLHQIIQNRSLFFMLLPGFFLILLFHYGPMYGLIIAFKQYNISEGIMGSPWVGLKQFTRFFSDPYALNVIKNTILISLYKLLCGFPVPIVLALLINEIGAKKYKNFVQTVSYLPHFLSWVIVSGVVLNVLSPNTGAVNQIIKVLGGEPVYFTASPEWFRIILVVSSIWKEMGWGTVIYLATITSIDMTQYEAAIVDGATRFQRMLWITLPSVLPVASITLILNMGHIMNAGFDQVFNLYNPMVMPVADIIDTYVYRMGLVGLDYSFSAAVGLFKSVVGLVMVLAVNYITRHINNSEYGLW